MKDATSILPELTELFRVDENCHATASAAYASVLVDCAAYYRALHEAIGKARHSIFVLGWDIDSRIKLVRDDADVEHPYFFDLIQFKARENSKLKIYLNRWDYSWFMFKDRELVGSHKWRKYSPPNVHYILDNNVPLGGSQHQKIIVIDDELAFCGGMDIALNRWDLRSHMPSDHHRIDPGAIDSQLHHFEPYHDTQMVVAGEIVGIFADLVRSRWKQAAGKIPLPLRRNENVRDLPETWPESVKVQFNHIQAGIALTQPAWGKKPAVHQVERMYIDLIAKAENFIYIENQFLSRLEIARALNKRMLEKPDLRVLLVSSFNPHGIFERKALWQSRVGFRDILEANGCVNKVCMAYPISRVKAEEKTIRIHSKLMVVDDRYLRVGSSNINNRSMRLDTECDIIFEAHTPNQQRQIAGIRNDLIREHTGQEIVDIQRAIDSGIDPNVFLRDLSTSRQHLRRIDDERYRNETFSGFVKAIADPMYPFISSKLSIVLSKMHFTRILLIIACIAGFALAWKYTPLSHYASPDVLIPFLENIREYPFAVAAGILVYTLATLALFPHMVMTGAIVLAFAPLQAFMIVVIASLLCSAIGFSIGKKLGIRSARSLVGDTAGKVSGYAKKGGIAGIALLRMLPIAPYTVVNITLGMLEVPFMTFMIGTFLGCLPGAIIAAYLGESVLELWKNPDVENLLPLVAGLIAWILMVVISHLSARWWRRIHRHKTVQA